MKKRILAVVLMLVMAVALIPAFSARAVYAADSVDEFPDATENAVNKTAYNSIYWAVGEGIIKGFGDGSFGPNDTCTREQFVVMIWRLAEKPSANAAVNFSDIASSRSTYKAIRWAVGQEIIKGYSDGTFKPEAKVTREQVAVMLWRMAGKPSATGSTSFTDVNSSRSTYGAIQWGASAGLIKGFSDGRFGPEEDCLRQQIVIFLYRYADNVEEKQMVIPEIKKVNGSTSAPAQPETPAPAQPQQPEKKTYYLMTKQTKTIPGAGSQVANYEYDSQGRVIRAYNDFVDATVSFESNGDEKIAVTRYDSNKNMQSREEWVQGPPNGMKSSTTYDAAGNITGKSTYEYDSHGNQLRITSVDETNTTNITTFDNTYSGDNLIKVKESQGGSIARTTEYTYDKDGHLASVKEYGENGKLSSSNEISGSTNIYKSYDMDGNIVSESHYKHTGNVEESEYYDYENGTKTLSSKQKTTYNSAHQMTENVNTDANGNVTYKTVYKYNSDGTLDVEEYYDGVTLSYKLVYVYTGGKLMEVHHEDASGTVSRPTKMTYDANGNLIKEDFYGSIIMEYEYQAFELENEPEEYIPGYIKMAFNWGAWSY